MNARGDSDKTDDWLSFGVFALASLLLFLVSSFRVSGLLLAGVCIILSIFVPRFRKRLTLVFVVLSVTLLIPVDVGWDGCPGRISGHKRSGPRLVYLAGGMPAHHELVERYGEYMSGSCAKSPFDPKWIFVLR